MGLNLLLCQPLHLGRQGMSEKSQFAFAVSTSLGQALCPALRSTSRDPFLYFSLRMLMSREKATLKRITKSDIQARAFNLST